MRNAAEVTAATEDFIASFGEDEAGLVEQLSKMAKKLRPASGYLEGYHATVTGIKANEAALAGQRIVLKPEWYELG